MHFSLPKLSAFHAKNLNDTDEMPDHFVDFAPGQAIADMPLYSSAVRSIALP
jgi:hypothetical protein